MRARITTPIIENQRVFIILMLSILFVILSLYNSVFGIIAFILDVYALLSVKPDKYIILLISLMPWAYIYKINGLSTSLYSIVILITTVKFLIELRKIDSTFFLLLLLFFANVFFHFSLSDTSMIVMFVKLIFNMILLYEMCCIHKPENMNAILVFLIISIILSSVFAYYFPNRTLFMNRIRLESTFVEFKYERFKGLQNDPNYYNSSLVISLLGLCYLFMRKQIGISFFLLSFACIYFGILTYSKSFFVMLILWAIVVIYYSIKKKRYLLGAILTLGGSIGIGYLFSGNIQAVNILLNRFTDASGLTSGRTNIWSLFINHFAENLTALLFGNGFETLIFQTHASHNSYIDLVYYFGLFGTALFISMVCVSFRQGSMNKRQPYPYIFGGFILIMYFFLSGLTMCELPFMLFLIFMFFNNDDKQEFIDGSI